MKRFVCVWMVWVLVATGSYAASGDTGLTLKAGSPGIGVDLTVGLGEKANLRLSGNAFSYTYDDYEFDEDEEEIAEVVDTVEATLDLLTLGAFLDWHPSGGSFRLSAGAFYNANEGSLSATAGDTISIGGEVYEVQSLDGVIEFNTFAPYLGIGWGNAAQADSHWHFAMDLGVLVQGSPKVSLTATATDPTVEIIAIDGSICPGTLIGHAGTVEERGRMAALLVAIPGPGAADSPATPMLGDYVQARLPATALEQVVQLPQSALRDGDRVWLATIDDELEIRSVSVAWRGHAYVYISEGLSEGERVITTTLTSAIAGTSLRIAGSTTHE